MQYQHIVRETETLSLGQLADILEVAQIIKTVDLGNTITHFITHPQRGNAIVVNNSEGQSLLIPQ